MAESDQVADRRAQRDAFATAAMAAMVGARGPMANTRQDGAEIAREAYLFADEMLAEMDRRNGHQDDLQSRIVRELDRLTAVLQRSRRVLRAAMEVPRRVVIHFEGDERDV